MLRIFGIIYAILVIGFVVQDCSKTKCSPNTLIEASVAPLMIGAMLREWSVGNL